MQVSLNHLYFSDRKMDLQTKDEEKRVRRITDRLNYVSSPINHGRIKWDRKDMHDLVTILKAFGKSLLFILGGDAGG